MVISESTFSTLEVRLFLSRRGWPYACDCFTRDTVGTERVTADFVEKWFKGYFPAAWAFTEYRTLETQVAQHMEIA